MKIADLPLGFTLSMAVDGSPSPALRLSFLDLLPAVFGAALYVPAYVVHRTPRTTSEPVPWTDARHLVERQIAPEDSLIVHFRTQADIVCSLARIRENEAGSLMEATQPGPAAGIRPHQIANQMIGLSRWAVAQGRGVWLVGGEEAAIEPAWRASREGIALAAANPVVTWLCCKTSALREIPDGFDVNREDGAFVVLRRRRTDLGIHATDPGYPYRQLLGRLFDRTMTPFDFSNAYFDRHQSDPMLIEEDEFRDILNDLFWACEGFTDDPVLLAEKPDYYVDERNLRMTARKTAVRLSRWAESRRSDR